MLKILAALYTMTLPFEQLWFEVFGVDTLLKPYRIVGLALVVASIVAYLSAAPRRRMDVVDVGVLFIYIMGFVMFVLWYLGTGKGNLSWALGDGALMGFAMAVFFALRGRLRAMEDIDTVLRAFAFGTVASILLYLVAFG